MKSRAELSAEARRRWKRAPVKFIQELMIDPETGRAFVLYPEQLDYLGRAFKFRLDGRLVHNELGWFSPKKSGKSTFGAQIVIYTAFALAPQHGEIYLLANDFDQAQSRIFKIVVQILQASPKLRGAVAITNNKITIRSTGTIIIALPNDYRGFAGSNPTLNCYDESAYYTSEASRRLWDEGIPSPARTISFRLSVSTAGFEQEESPLKTMYDRMVKPELSIAPDLYEAGNALVFWSNRPELAPASYPDRLGWIEEQRAALPPTQFARLVENRWVTSEQAFVQMREWDLCVGVGAKPIEADPTRQVYVGLDIGLRHDASALMVVSNEGESVVRLLTHKLFIPHKGETLDVAATIEAEILSLSKRFTIRGVIYDPWQGVYLRQRLEKQGITMVECNQIASNQTMMTLGLVDLIRQRRLLLYQSDELRLACSQTVIIESSRGMRLGKTKAANRIDAMVALAMAGMAAIQRRGVGPMRVYTFGNDPRDLVEVKRYVSHEDETVPNYDVGFTDPSGRLLPKPEPPDPPLPPDPTTVLVSNWRGKGIQARINLSDYDPRRDGTVLELVRS